MRVDFSSQKNNHSKASFGMAHIPTKSLNHLGDEAKGVLRDFFKADREKAISIANNVDVEYSANSFPLRSDKDEAPLYYLHVQLFKKGQSNIIKWLKRDTFLDCYTEPEGEITAAGIEQAILRIKRKMSIPTEESLEMFKAAENANKH